MRWRMPSAIYSKTRNPCDFCFATLSSAILCERKRKKYWLFCLFICQSDKSRMWFGEIFQISCWFTAQGMESKIETFIFRRNYPLLTHIMELFLRISPVCQMTAALLRLNLNFESDLLDDPHLVQQLIITWRKRSSPEVCPRCVFFIF